MVVLIDLAKGLTRENSRRSVKCLGVILGGENQPVAEWALAADSVKRQRQTFTKTLCH